MEKAETSKFKLLNEPYPLTPNSGIVRMALMYGLFVFLFLFLFQPFGLSSRNTLGMLIVTGIYGLITLFVTLIYLFGMRRLFPSFFIEKNWTFGRELLSTVILIFLIGVFNLLYSNFQFNFGLSIGDFFMFQFYTIAVGIFPIVIIMLLRYINLNHKNTADAFSLSNKLHHRKIDSSVDEMICISSELKSDDLILPVTDLIYVESADNYVNIFYLDNEKLKSRLLRSTLTKVESEAQNHESLVRCHRAFIVNINHVDSFSGNAQGLQLRLNHTDTIVPVSRKMVALIRTKLG